MKNIGLSQKEANRKLKRYGYNEIKEIVHISAFQILLRQIKKNFVVYLLIAATIISFFVGKAITGYTVLLVIAIVIIVGFLQEYKAERAIKAMKKMIIPISIVVRDWKEVEIPSREIVPGDVILLRTGEKIPADCVVLEEKELRVDESILTGESQGVRKFAAKNEKNYNKDNLIFMGTHVINGKCIAKVLHTGMNTEFGKIAAMISKAEKELPLQNKVNDLAKYLAYGSIIISAFTGFVILSVNSPFSYALFLETLVIVVALCVAGFPEGFPVTLISTLATGAHRMAKKNAIVNRMSIIETLGETTVICADKTGTITKGEMTAKHIFVDEKFIDILGVGYEAEGDFLHDNKKIDIQKNIPLKLLLKCAILCNDASIERKGIDKEYDIRGSPTEASLLVMSAKVGMFREDIQFSREEEIPFSSERKMMSVLCREDEEIYVYSKGAPEVLIEKCKFIQRGGDKVLEFDEKEKEKILDFNKKFTLKKFRVISFAYKKTTSFDKNHFEKDLIFLGLVALEDPPREEVRDALKICKDAGIKVKMITGDSKETAVEIAREINLRGGNVITGEELDRITDDELSKIVNEITIFARVSPRHKLRIVKALKQNNEVVTMTGDGVNDAPALKESHIGVAMGIKGTDVSKESADLILKDDHFSTIVSAIIEGRTIFHNIQKFATYQISINIAQLSIIFLAVLIAALTKSSIVLPLAAMQILFMNLLSDETTAITLGFSPPSLDVMKIKPRKKSQIIDKQLFIMLITAATIMCFFSLGVFYYTLNILRQDIPIVRTVTLITMVFFGITNAFNFRSFRYPVHKLPLFANKYLIYASLLSILMTFLIVYTPMNTIFETVPIKFQYWVLAFLVSLSIILVFDIWKMINYRKIEAEIKWTEKVHDVLEIINKEKTTFS